MKRGQTVAVCYDGKWGRRVKGVVIATKQSRICVRFNLWSDPAVQVTHWFHARRKGRKYGGPSKRHAGFVPVDDSLMQKLGIGPGDWYAIYKWRDQQP